MAVTVFGILAMYKNVQAADAGQSWYKQIFEGLGSNPVDTGVTLLTFICTWSLVFNLFFFSFFSLSFSPLLYLLFPSYYIYILYNLS